MKAKKEKVSFTINSDLVKALQELAKDQNRNLSNMAEVVLYEGFEKIKNKEQK